MHDIAVTEYRHGPETEQSGDKKRFHIATLKHTRSLLSFEMTVATPALYLCDLVGDDLWRGRRSTAPYFLETKVRMKGMRYGVGR